MEQSRFLEAGGSSSVQEITVQKIPLISPEVSQINLVYTLKTFFF
jgi:hypothetical protein